MTGVERDAGERAYEPSADCERGGTIARALVLGPILVVPGTWRGRATAGAVGEETRAEGEGGDANVPALARMLALAGGVDLEVGRTVPTERCVIVFCLPNPPLPPKPISSSLAFPFEVDTGVALSFAALFNLTIIPAKSDNGADPVPLLSLLLLTAAEDKVSDAPDRERA